MSTAGIRAKIDLGEIQDGLDAVASLLDGAGKTSLFRSLAQTLESETEANFEAQGRPSWAPLSAATKAERMKRNKGSSVLQILKDGGILASSISSYFDDETVVVGAGGAARAYAAIHQYGGTIERPAQSVKTRLRTDRKGNLLRQSAEGPGKNLAVFARDKHKQARESWSTVDAYKIDIPARPYLPFSGPPGGEQLQPAAASSILQVFERALLRKLG
ncbi:MAG TPA: phage virion morphogenesis protein [Aquabacterium sp.]|nr:phage virion morphogenesis protein [Aquabacterium sp.]